MTATDDRSLHPAILKLRNAVAMPRETDAQVDRRHLRELLAAVQSLEDPLNAAVRNGPTIVSVRPENFERDHARQVAAMRSFDALTAAIAGVLGRADAMRSILGRREQVPQ